jgi:hypothetical protein
MGTLRDVVICRSDAHKEIQETPAKGPEERKQNVGDHRHFPRPGPRHHCKQNGPRNNRYQRVSRQAVYWNKLHRRACEEWDAHGAGDHVSRVEFDSFTREGLKEYQPAERFKHDGHEPDDQHGSGEKRPECMSCGVLDHCHRRGRWGGIGVHEKVADKGAIFNGGRRAGRLSVYQNARRSAGPLRRLVIPQPNRRF